MLDFAEASIRVASETLESTTTFTRHFAFLKKAGENFHKWIARMVKVIRQDHFFSNPCTKPFVISAEQISPPITFLRQTSTLAYTVPSCPS